MNKGTKLFAAMMFALAATTCIQFSATVEASPFQCADPGCTSCAPAPTMLASCDCGQSACTGCAASVPTCDCGQANCSRCIRPQLRSRAGCRCGKSSCRTCKLRRPCRSCNSDCGCVQCPSCEGDICKLELDKSKIKKSCFKVEQKTICVPKVRMPWQKCCPPSKSKTRLINVLKKHSYECPNCSYKWSVQKPAPAAEPTSALPHQAMPMEAYEVQPQVQGQFLAPETRYLNEVPTAPAPPAVDAAPWRVNSAPQGGTTSATTELILPGK